jgi:hypothetical protein
LLREHLRRVQVERELMGCGCGKGKLPATAKPERWAALVNKTYQNSTEEALVSRIPRLALAPRDTIELTQEMMTYSIRMWIRNGDLALVEEEPVVAKTTKKAAAKATA